ncbi:MAG: response regulator, partial [Bryobacteraceae bacterium]
MQNSKKVLAVVSDLLFAAKINEAAKKAGVAVEPVTSGPAVLAKASEKPLLIIFDLGYEAVDPIGLIEKLKADRELKQISLIGFLSHVEVELKQRALEAGCD